MSERDKQDMVRRHYRGAARFERRKENEARRVRRDPDEPGRPRVEDEVEDWDDEVRTRSPRRRGGRARPAQRDASGARTARTGTVVAIARNLVRVRTDDAETDAMLSPALRSTPLAVGDEVELLERPGAPPRVEDVLERRSVLSRPDPGNRHRERVIAANVDVGAMVAAAKDPPFRPGLIDRYVIAFERGGVEPLLVVNKCDLLDEAERAELDEVLAPYRAIGLAILAVSAADGTGVEELRAALAGRVAVLVGHSGVGKSSLLNALAGSALAGEGAVRAHDGRGRHTTTSSALFDLAGGVRLIDTPGVRELGLWGLTRAQLARDFPGFEPWRADCRFGDCAHLDEPDCGVRLAVEAGELAEARYTIYVRMCAALDADSG
jgi:ribosome biogenesis GTPase